MIEFMYWYPVSEKSLAFILAKDIAAKRRVDKSFIK
jgi:hypothetical protein